MLTGQELLAKVKEMGDAPKTELATACGYVSKKKQKKGSLLWDARQNSWIFFCAKKGSVECMNSKSFSNLISALNPALGEAYRRDRWHSGTTGKGHNCRAPRGGVGVSTGSYGVMISKRLP